MKKSGVILEDKEIFDVNKVHKNVLRPMPRILNQKVFFLIIFYINFIINYKILIFILLLKVSSF